jgi:polysaccharide export outer membrane protein
MLAALLIALVSLGDQVPAQAKGGADATETANYVVGPDDVLTVTVFNEPQLSGKFRVENDGQFDYPFLGRIKAGGTTVGDIAGVVKAKLADGYLRNPQVTVDVEQFRSQSVFVMGEVRSPGKYVLTGSVTLIEALAQAGSTTPGAGSDILILHPKEPTKGAPTLPQEGDADVQRVSLRDIQGGKLSQNVQIRDGDTIFVPKADRFFVTGQVRNPGSFVLEPNTTVLQAISMAGGVSDRGSNRRIRIIRVVNNKKQEFDANPTDLVQPGDTIMVRQRLL